MPFSEYEQMQDQIKSLQEIINELRKDPRVVLIEDRYMGNPPIRHLHGYVPKIIAQGNEAVDFLQRQYDDLANDFKELHAKHLNYVENNPRISDEDKEWVNSSWWKSIKSFLIMDRTR